VVQPVQQRLFQGDAQADAAVRVAQPHAHGVFLQMGREQRDQAGVVFQNKPIFQIADAFQQRLAAAVDPGGRQHAVEGFVQVALQGALGDVAGRAPLQRLHGRVLAPLRRHQDDGRRRVAVADRLHQFQPVHARHVQVGHHGGARLAPEDRQRLPAVAGEHGPEPRPSFHQAADEAPRRRRIVHHQDRREIFGGRKSLLLAVRRQ